MTSGWLGQRTTWRKGGRSSVSPGSPPMARGSLGSRWVTPLLSGRYLGCEHIIGETVSPITGKRVRVLEYDVSEFLGQCVGVYCQQFDVKQAHLSKRKVGTPFADDVKKLSLIHI
eukprot:6281140-Alexandrium_andersonii.AAC.1